MPVTGVMLSTHSSGASTVASILNPHRVGTEFLRGVYSIRWAQLAESIPLRHGTGTDNLSPKGLKITSRETTAKAETARCPCFDETEIAKPQPRTLQLAVDIEGKSKLKTFHTTDGKTTRLPYRRAVGALQLDLTPDGQRGAEANESDDGVVLPEYQRDRNHF